MSSKELGQLQGDHRFSKKYLSFLRQVLKPMERYPDAYVYIACFAIGAAGSVGFAAAAGFQQTASQFFQTGSFYFLAAGVVCSLGWAYRPWRGDLKELQQLRNFRVELIHRLARMIAEHVLRCRAHAAIFYERELKEVPENELDGQLNDYADQYHDRWHHINTVLHGGKIEPGTRG